MTVRAKFRCNSITDNGTQLSVNLTAVYGKEGENADYARYTPCGSLQITVDKDTKAHELFTPQQDYWLDFTKVEK